MSNERAVATAYTVSFYPYYTQWDRQVVKITIPNVLASKALVLFLFLSVKSVYRRYRIYSNKYLQMRGVRQKSEKIKNIVTSFPLNIAPISSYGFRALGFSAGAGFLPLSLSDILYFDYFKKYLI